jgi:hydrogenase maturation protease
VIGVGNALRGDDAVGPAVAGVVAARVPEGVSVSVCEAEPSRLLDAFGAADVAVLVDAVSTGAALGTVHRFDLGETPVPPGRLRSSSTHALGIGEVVELARALGRLPRRTVVYGIEGSEFTAGEGLSPPVAAAVERAAAAVLREVLEPP